MKKKSYLYWLIFSLEILAILLFACLSVFLTKQLWLIAFAAALIIGVIALYILQRKKYETDLEIVTDMIDHIISDADNKLVSEVDDVIKSKIQHQLVRLKGIIVTQREKAQQDKEEIRDLIVEIAHQLRMPLANIQTYLDLLKDEHLSNTEKEKYITAIEISEKKLNFLIEGFIKMSRLENRIIQIKKEDNDIKNTIINAIGQVENAATEKNIDIQYIQENDIYINHDKNWLGEAIFNIVDNAVKYSKPRSVIEISLAVNDMFAIINVRDYGIGINDGEENEIFKRFYRGQKVTNEEGFGIGLYIAREIVIRHGGFIKAKVETSGMSFSFYLPNTEN